MAETAYIARFGEHRDWNALHDAQEWQPLTSDEVDESDAVQRLHFTAFFRPAHETRYPLPPTQSLCWTQRVVRDCFQRRKTDWVWLNLNHALRTRVLLKRHVRRLRCQWPQQRSATLEAWLTYWQEAEATAQDNVRGWLRSGKPASGEWQGPVPLAQVLTPTCEEVKAQVLWELYWLLHAQMSRQKRVYWVRCQALLRQRQRMRWKVASLIPSEPEAQTPDFWNHEPVSLRAVNAALFVMALRRPRFHYRAGQEVTLKQLLLFVNAPQPAFGGGDGDAVRHASGVVNAFLDSPLCHEAAWLRKRLNMPLPLIPPRTWRPTAADAPDVAPGEAQSPRLLLEERGSFRHDRRLRSLPVRGNSPMNRGQLPPSQSQSPRGSSSARDRAPSAGQCLPEVPRQSSCTGLPAGALSPRRATLVRSPSSHLGTAKPLLRVPPPPRIVPPATPTAPREPGLRRHAVVGSAGNLPHLQNRDLSPLKMPILPPLRS
eukprot:EG_transcript_4049